MCILHTSSKINRKSKMVNFSSNQLFIVEHIYPCTHVSICSFDWILTCCYESVFGKISNSKFIDGDLETTFCGFMACNSVRNHYLIKYQVHNRLRCHVKALMALNLQDGNCRESGKMKENYTKCPSSLLKLYVVILSFCKSKFSSLWH